MVDKLIKEIKNDVAYIWINRPDKKNALDFDVWFGIPDLIDEIVEKDEAKCILLLGKGDSFSAGIDITVLMQDMNLNENLSSTYPNKIWRNLAEGGNIFVGFVFFVGWSGCPCAWDWCSGVGL